MADAAQSLAQLRTLAAMNLTQSKYKSKFYYDQRQNVRHFREGEMVYVLKKPTWENRPGICGPVRDTRRQLWDSQCENKKRRTHAYRSYGYDQA